MIRAFRSGFRAVVPLGNHEHSPNRARQHRARGDAGAVGRRWPNRPSRRPRASAPIIVCFPECFVPGYRGVGKAACRRPIRRFSSAPGRRSPPRPRRGNVAVVLGTERIVDGRLLISALVVDRDGTIAGFQDKVQLDPSEEGIYAPGSGRRVFRTGPLTFGIAICHEGWRYPETVRWAARRGAQVVFHPHFHEAEPGGYRPVALRASPPTPSTKRRPVPRGREHLLLRDGELRQRGFADDVRCGAPDGTLLGYQPYGTRRSAGRGHRPQPSATGLLASRFRPL